MFECSSPNDKKHIVYQSCGTSLLILTLTLFLANMIKNRRLLTRLPMATIVHTLINLNVIFK